MGHWGASYAYLEFYNIILSFTIQHPIRKSRDGHVYGTRPYSGGRDNRLLFA